MKLLARTKSRRYINFVAFVIFTHLFCVVARNTSDSKTNWPFYYCPHIINRIIGKLKEYVSISNDHVSAIVAAFYVTPNVDKCERSS